MSQTKLLDELNRRRPPAPSTPDRSEPITLVPTVESDDSWEEPSGDGRVSRHPVLGVQLLEGRKLLAWVPYAAIVWGDSADVTRRLVLETARGDVLYKVVLEGDAPGFQAVADQLLEGKRVSCRVNAASITAITVEAVATKK